MAHTARHRADGPSTGPQPQSDPEAGRADGSPPAGPSGNGTDSHGGAGSHGRADGHGGAGSHRGAGHDGGESRRSRGARPAALDGALGLLLGLVAGLLGLAPWLADGARLPLQNLWAEPTLPEDMPLSALPLSQYLTSDLVALMVAGGLAAGLGLRWWAPTRRLLAVGSAVAGLLAVQLAATVQAFSLLEGLKPGTFSDMYRDGLPAGVLFCVAAAVVVALAVSARRSGPAALGVALAAVPLGSWFLAWSVTSFASYDVPEAVLRISDWLPAVLIGLTLGWYTAARSGSGGGAGGPVRRGRVGRVGPIVVWVVSLGLLWVVPAALMAVRAALGSRIHLGDVPVMADFALTALQAELQAGWLPVLVAAVLAAAGADVLGRVRSARAASGPGAGRSALQ